MPAGTSSAARPTTRSPKKPHFEAKAKRVIFLFMSGGPTHVDTFDPKPELTRLHGQKLPASFGPVKTRRGVDKNKLLATKRTFKKYGQSGIEVSDWFPHIGELHRRHLRAARLPRRQRQASRVGLPDEHRLDPDGPAEPGAGSSYGLGTENQNMPAFVVLPDPGGWLKGGAPAWGNGFLPAAYQGTVVRGGKSPILHLANRRRRVEPSSSGGRSTSSPRATANISRPAATTRNWPPASPPTNSPSACRPHAPEVVDLAQGNGGDQAALRPRPQGDGRVRHALPAGPAAGRTRRALRAALLRRHQRLGRPLRPRRQPRQALPAERQADRRAAHGPEAPRAARTTRW